MRVTASIRDVMPAPAGCGGMMMEIRVMTARLSPAPPPPFDGDQRASRAAAQDRFMYPPIATIEEFYANALAIEREAAQRYDEFTAYFEDHGEDALAGLCRSLADAERSHYEELATSSLHMVLPAIPEGRYRWLEGDSPEAPAREFVYRVARPRHLLEIALAAEWRAHEFFKGIARTSPSLAVRELAAVMAAEETEHVKWVRNALEYHTATATTC
jgi:rubrerythrin